MTCPKVRDEWTSGASRRRPNPFDGVVVQSDRYDPPEAGRIESSLTVDRK